MAADKLHQQAGDFPTVFGAIDIARSQIADQQMPATEHIKRQVTVMIIIAVEESTFLFAMQLQYP